MASAKEPTCPSGTILGQFSSGALPADELAVVFEHLEGCPRCQAQIQTLDGTGDTLVQCLRQVDVGEKPDPPLALQKMLAAAIENGLAHEKTTRARNSAADDGPRMIRDYRLLEKLGQGGMGEVYKALHIRLNKTVALKLLSAERMSSATMSRFQREMRAGGLLDHPNITRTTDGGEQDGQPFLVMEYVAGLDLSRLMERQGPLSIAEACEIIRQAALGLQHAHENGLIHRDLKPSNLMLAPDGRTKILDLGLALLDESSTETELTSAGQMMGTADYMAPEQVGNSHGVDIRADIYSLGCTLFKLLVGEAPFAGPRFKTAVQKIVGHSEHPAPNASERRADVPAELSALLARVMAKRPDDRPSTPAEFAAALSSFCVGADTRALIQHALRGDQSPPPVSAGVSPAPATQLAPEVAPSTPASRGWWGAKATIALTAAAILLISLGVYITLRTPQGEVIVELADDMDPKEVKIEVSGNGEMHVVDVTQGWTIHVDQGRYDVKLAGGTDRFDLEPKVVTVKRNETTRVRVTLKTADLGGGPGPSAPVSPADVSAPGKPKPILTLDHLKKVNIPEEERFSWQPDELVAVIGKQGLRSSRPWSISFHPSGKYLVTSSEFGPPVAFSTATWKRCPMESDVAFDKFGLQGHAIDFSQDGTKCSMIERIGWLDTRTPGNEPRVTRVASPPATPAGLLSMAWVGADFLAVATVEKGTIEIWDMAEDTPTRHMTLHCEFEFNLGDLASSNDGKRLVAGHGPWFVWDVDWSSPSKPTFVRRFTVGGPGMEGIRWWLSGDGTKLVVPTPTGTRWELFDLTGTAPVVEETLEFGQVVGISSDGKFLVNGLGIYMKRDGKYAIATALPSIVSAAFSPDGRWLVTGGEHGRLHVFDLTTTPPKALEPLEPEGDPNTPFFSSDGRYLALNCIRDRPTVWDLSGMEPVRKVGAEEYHANHPASIEGRYAYLCGQELWDLAAEPATRVGVFPPPTGPRRLAKDGSGFLMELSGNALGRRGWEITRLGRFLPGELEDTVDLYSEDKPGGLVPDRNVLDFRPDQNRLIAQSGDLAKLGIWRLDQPKSPPYEIPVPEGKAIHMVRGSADGRYLAVWFDRLFIWDFSESPPRMYETPLPFNGQSAMEFDATGRRIIFSDRSVSVYDWARDGLTGRIDLNMQTRGMAFHPDGRHVAVVKADGMTYILRLPDWATRSLDPSK